MPERDRITGGSGGPVTGEDLEAFVSAFRQREFDETVPPAGEKAPESAAQDVLEGPLANKADEREESPLGAGAHAAKETHSPWVSAPIDDSPGEDDTAGRLTALTTVDRCCLAWKEF